MGSFPFPFEQEVAEISFHIRNSNTEQLRKHKLQVKGAVHRSAGEISEEVQ